MREQFQCLTCGGKYFDRGTDASVYMHVCGPQSLKPLFTLIPYDNLRNENMAATKGGVIAGIVSEGAGVKCLSNPTLTEPPWITVVKSRAAAQGD